MWKFMCTTSKQENWPLHEKLQAENVYESSRWKLSYPSGTCQFYHGFHLLYRIRRITHLGGYLWNWGGVPCGAQDLCSQKSYFKSMRLIFFVCERGTIILSNTACWVLSLYALHKWALTNCSAQIFSFPVAWLQTNDNISIFILKSLLCVVRYEVLQ